MDETVFRQAVFELGMDAMRPTEEVVDVPGSKYLLVGRQAKLLASSINVEGVKPEDLVPADLKGCTEERKPVEMLLRVIGGQVEVYLFEHVGAVLTRPGGEPEVLKEREWKRVPEGKGVWSVAIRGPLNETVVVPLHNPGEREQKYNVVNKSVDVKRYAALRNLKSVPRGT